jgi:hypothetical protein
MSYKLSTLSTILAKYILFNTTIPIILKLYFEICTQTQRYFPHIFHLNLFQHYKPTKRSDTPIATHCITTSETNL